MLALGTSVTSKDKKKSIFVSYVFIGVVQEVHSSQIEIKIKKWIQSVYVNMHQHNTSIKSSTRTNNLNDKVDN